MSSDLVNELLIFQKWRDSSLPIKLKLTSATVSLEAWGTVAAVKPDLVAFDLRDGAGVLQFDPSSCVMQYGDTREADPSVKADVEAKVVCVVTVSLALGIDLLLYEYRLPED
jgi:hypothetical protein